MPRACDHIDNALYNAESDTWWQPDSALYLLKTTVNPVRVGYARKKLLDELKLEPNGKRALEVGCGGGILCEEIAAMGFETIGIDPSERSLHFAGAHARQNGLDIRYEKGSGEALPYGDNTFDVVFCCDVLEHVHDPNRVIAEISRVLKSGGVFCYDTINRTLISKLVAICISQQWKRWAFMPPNLHCWEMFIQPGELISFLRGNNLEWQGHRGVGIKGAIPQVLGYLHRRARGEWGYQELGERLRLKESSAMGVMYMGYAIKR